MKFLLFISGIFSLVVTNLSFTKDGIVQSQARNEVIPYSINQLLGNINIKEDDRLILVRDDDPLLRPNKSGMTLEKETFAALLRASKDFQREFPKIPFFVLSGMRNFSYQRMIWERKWKSLATKKGMTSAKIRREILKYSSMPGTSRHHWGTDVDLVFLNSKDFQTPLGKKVYRWMKENLPKYGFAQCFNIGRKGGYNTEEWHWSYIPVSSQYIKAYRAWLEREPEKILRVIRAVQGLSKKDISDEELMKTIKEYVFTVAPSCI